jgi:hypothetical protein
MMPAPSPYRFHRSGSVVPEIPYNRHAGTGGTETRLTVIPPITNRIASKATEIIKPTLQRKGIHYTADFVGSDVSSKFFVRKKGTVRSNPNIGIR